MTKKTKTKKPVEVEPTESVEKEIAVSEIVQPEPMPELPKPVIPLKVFLQVFGKKWDQVAGFVHYAKANKLEPLTVVEWREAFEAFMNRPTE